MDNNQAFRPDNSGIFPSLQDPNLNPKEEVREPNDPEEEALAFISDSGGWKVLNDYIYSLIEELDGQVLELMAGGASFEEIGQKTAVKEVVKSYLMRIVEKVEDAKESIESEPVK